MERTSIEVTGGVIEAIIETIGGARTEGGTGRTIAAAHPADTFDEGTVALLQESSGARVICVNPRGLGGSSARPPGHGLEEMVDDLEAARRRLGIDHWVFWGMSGGGWLGEIYAHRYPAALSGLILESTCGCFRARLADPACILSPFHPAWRRTLEAQGLIDAASHAHPGDPADTEWAEIAGVGSVFRRRGGPALLVSPMAISEVMRETMPALWTTDARPWLPEIRVPTLVVCGSDDPVVPVAQARAVHEAIPGSRFVVVAGAGHVPTAARRPEVSEAVRAFL